MTQNATRIVILAPNATGSDGVATVVRLALGLWPPHSGHGVEVWTLREESMKQGSTRPPGVYWTAAGSRVRYLRQGARAAFQSWKGTIVLVMHLSLAPVALPLAARGAKLAVFLHGIECWRRLRLMERISLRRADLLIANSHHTVTRFKQANPAFAPREVAVCHLGAEGATGSRGITNAPDSKETPFALIVGRMSSEERYKGHDLLLDLWPEVRREVPTARLLIVGGGDDRERLKAKAQQAGLGDAVCFAGRVDDQRLALIYRKCEFFVMPSPNEGFGLVFLEAMGAGKACIGGVGAASEVIEHGVTGFVVDPADAAATRSAIVRLFREPDLSRQMGDAGASRFRLNFTANDFRRRLWKILSPLTEDA